MEGAEIPGRIRNIWSKQKYREQEYREEIGIYGDSRNSGKK
jgi:hypothetical protein